MKEQREQSGKFRKSHHFTVMTLFNQEKTTFTTYHDKTISKICHDILSHITIRYNMDLLPSPNCNA